MWTRDAYLRTADEYLNGPFTGIIVTGTNYQDFYLWAEQASYLIDELTFGRAPAHAEALHKELSYACGRIAEVLYQNHTAKMTAVGGLASVSNDGYSETYVSARDVDAYIRRECFRILEEALGNDPYGLLYLGVD